MDENMNEDFTLTLTRKEMVMVDFALRMWSKKESIGEENQKSAEALAVHIRRILGKAF